VSCWCILLLSSEDSSDEDTAADAAVHDADVLSEVNPTSNILATNASLVFYVITFNRLESRCNYSATSNDTKLVHWPLMGGLFHLVQRGGDCHVEWYEVGTLAPLMGGLFHLVQRGGDCHIEWYEVGTLAPLMGGLLHSVQRGGDWMGPQPTQAPPRCTKHNSQPTSGQCADQRIDV